MAIGVANPASILYAVYVRYDHRPGGAEQFALSGTGVTMVWPFRQHRLHREPCHLGSGLQSIAALLLA